MTSAPLISNSDAATLAGPLGALGSNGLALLRQAETLLVKIRGDEVFDNHQRVCGSAVEIVTPSQRHHLYSPGCSPAALDRLISSVRSSQRLSWHPAPPDEAVLPDDIATAMRRLAQQVAHRILTGGHPTLQPIVEADASRVRIALLRTDGSLTADDRLHLDLRIGARLADAPATARALRIVSGGSIDLLCRNDRHMAAADEVSRVAVHRAEAVDPPEGEMPVVLAPAGPAALIHEVCGHGLEADIACAPGAAYRGMIGSQVASPLVTVIDDPGAPDTAPLYRRDDEGRLAQPTVLIDRGMLTGYLADGECARRTGHPPTGNGRRLDHSHPALTRMSCTFVAAGEAPPEDALIGFRRGLYVKAIVTGETDMSGGAFSARVTEGYLVENGALTAPIRAARLHGIGTDVLRGIDFVGDDLDFLPFGFQCNKLSQHPLTVSVGQPTIRIRSMGVGTA